jgi:putative endonuclease
MTSPTQQIGFSKEAEACAYLQKQGLSLLQQQYHCRYGEIDLVMQDDHCLVFVEVRLRRNQQGGCAIASITPTKQKKIIHTAEHYLFQHPDTQHLPCRFDVVAFDGWRSQPLWVKHAFDGGA